MSGNWIQPAYTTYNRVNTPLSKKIAHEQTVNGGSGSQGVWTPDRHSEDAESRASGPSLAPVPLSIHTSGGGRRGRGVLYNRFSFSLQEEEKSDKGGKGDRGPALRALGPSIFELQSGQTRRRPGLAPGRAPC